MCLEYVNSLADLSLDVQPDITEAEKICWMRRFYSSYLQQFRGRFDVVPYLRN